MNNVTGDIGISYFMNSVGFHDNRLTGINISNGDLEVRLDDLYANVHNDLDEKMPGSIIVRNCNWIYCNNHISDWIVEGEYLQNDIGVSIKLVLNMGTILEFRGSHVEIHQDVNLA